MKRRMSALLALALCASMALSEPVEIESGDAAAAVSEPPATPMPQAAGAEKSGFTTVEAPLIEAAQGEAASEAEQTPREAIPGPTEASDDGADAGAEADPDGAAGDLGEASGEVGETPDGAGADSTEAPDAGAQGDAQGEEASQEQPSPEAGAPSGDPAANPGDPTADSTQATAEPEGYVLVGEERKTGTLAELLAVPGEKTVYLLAKEPVTIPEFKLALLQNVTLLPDPEAFPEGKYAVKLMNGEAEITPEAIAAATDEVLTLTVSVEELPDPEEPPAPGEVRLRVTPRNYTAGAWMNTPPEFQLSGISEDQAKQGYSYLVMLYGEELVSLKGDFYLPQKEGVYTLCFAIMDPLFDMVSKSEVYEVMLDLTPPALALQVSESQNYTMTLSAVDVPGGDPVSGVAEFSLDGGATWAPLGEGESVVHSETRRKVFPPQTILVRDLAGNVSGNEEEIVLDKLPDYSMGGWGGGDGGSTQPKVPHASGDGDDSPYAAYELALPDGAVDVLTLGGEEIDLGLAVDGSEGERFTAELAAWAREDAPQEEPAKDTLVVRAQPDEAQPEGGAAVRTYAWRVNGSVLRKLYNSEIQYLALEAGDAVLSLPTVGFTAGTKYAELKMGGVSTSEFEYEITMRTGEGHPLCAWNLSADCDVELAVVVGGERFDMMDRDTTPEMYAYDVYCGPEDLPDYPYGAYPGME